MEIKQKPLPNSQIELVFELTIQEFEPYLDEAARELSRTKKIEGFRPGMAPRNVIEQKFGSFALYEKAAEFAVKKVYVATVLEKKLDVIGTPEIEIQKLAPGNEFVFKTKASLMPEIKLPDYKKIASEIKKEKKDTKIEQKEIDEALSWLQNSRAQIKETSQPAKTGNVITMDISTKSSGIPVDSGTLESYQFVLGQGKFIPGVEEKIAGMNKGDIKNFELTAPSDWPDKNIAGKYLEFEIKINDIKEKIAPELNDEFAKSLGKFENLESVKKSIGEGLTREKESKEKGRLRLIVIDKISKEMRVALPPILIESETNQMIAELKESVINIGMKFENYLAQIKKSEEELRKELREQAEKRVIAGLILNKIAEKESLEPVDEEVEEKFQELLQREFDPKVRSSIDPDKTKNYLRSIIKNEKVFEFLEKLYN